MADIRLISIQPSQPVQGVQSSQGAGANAASPQIGGLPAGTVLSGFILNRDGSGNPILRTTGGDVVFESNFFLKIGSEVVIRVENAGGGTLAHILSVDGQPPEVAEAQSAFAQEPEVIVSQNFTQPQANIPVQAAQTSAAEPPVVTVTGTLVSPPAQTLPGAPPPLAEGTQLTLRIVTLTVPQAQAAQTATPATATAVQANPASYASYTKLSGNPAVAPAAASALPSAPLGTPATTLPAAQVVLPVSASQATSQAPAAANTPVQQTQNPAPTNPLSGAGAATITTAAQPSIVTTAVQTTSPALPANPPAIAVPTAASVPSAPEATSATILPGQTLSATVIGREPTGEALVQTPIGVVRLQPGSPIPNGSSITFTLVQATPAQAAIANPILPAAAAPLTELARQWTALQQVFSLLTGRSTQTGLDMSLNTLPGAAPQNNQVPQISPQSISAGLMAFLAAIRNDDFRNWLGGANAQWLEDQGYGSVLKKAESEFSLLSRQFTDVPPQHWQPLFFPVVAFGALQQVRAFIKRDRKQGSGPQAKGSEDTRFVVEVDLTQLGELQMDGFVRRQGKDVQFDMMIRSLIPLPADIQQDILRIYNDTGALTGYKGSLIFQAVREFPVNPMEDIVQGGWAP